VLLESVDTVDRKLQFSPCGTGADSGETRWRNLYLFAILEEMPKRIFLGEMELMVLLALVRLGDDAYGVPISKELISLAGREVALGSIYAALDRLEEKAFVVSKLGEPTPERGGRAKRYFRVTRAGLKALRMTRTALTNLWSGVPLLEGEHT
jgi:PadR family transcriptional regulator, regulatory protein PadR